MYLHLKASPHIKQKVVKYQNKLYQYYIKCKMVPTLNQTSPQIFADSLSKYLTYSAVLVLSTTYLFLSTCAPFYKQIADS